MTGVPMLERRGVFAALLAALLVGLLVASFDYGITIDEYSRQRNGEMVFEFYRSGLETVTYAQDKGRFYSGFFDTLAVTMQHLLPFDTFETRHLVNAFFGWLGVLYTGLLARRLFGNTAAVVAVLFLVLSPRYLGHMMNNPKDIPFASLHIMALYYLSLASVNWPTMRTRHLIMLGISIGLATGVRVGGVVLLCYAMTYIGLLFLANRAAYRQSYRWAISGLGSFVLTAGLSLGASGAAPPGISLLAMLGGYIVARAGWTLATRDEWAHRLREIVEHFGADRRLGTAVRTSNEVIMMLQVAGTIVLAFAVILSFWPWAMMDPLRRVPEAISTFSNYPHYSWELYGGKLIHSGTVCCENWHYIPNWIARTTPAIVVAGLALLPFSRFCSVRVTAVGLLAFVIVAPWVYGLIAQANYYDGWRHFFFVYPPIVLLAAAGWLEGYRIAARFRFGRSAFAATSLVIALADSGRFIVTNHPHQSVYFSPLFGGMRAALGQYELDYWQHCSLESMEAISALGQEGETLRVYGGWKMTDTYAEQLGNIENITERVDGEYQVDYSIVNFKHVVPPDVLWFAEKANSIHRVDVDGVPICMVVKGDSGVRCRFDPTDGSRICWVLPRFRSLHEGTAGGGDATVTAPR